MKYRLVVGEMDNEKGHIIRTNAVTLRGAKIALGRAMAKLKGDGWGRIQYLRVPAKDSVTGRNMWDAIGDI